MIMIDDSYLNKLGVIQDPEYRAYMSTQIVDLLNMRVANRVAELLDDNILNEIMSLPDGRKMAWLESNIPDFKDIVDEELRAIIDDMKAVMP